ncbi:MAG: hypothetical protein ACRD3J_10020 [Thermoanaerobaculia bacterium]
MNSCLEEILLHTNDGVEPHTKTTVAYIQQLKKKHGMTTTATGVTGSWRSEPID